MADTAKSARTNVVRAMTQDGGFRVVAACTTTLARDAAAVHKITGSAAAMYAELLTGAVLLRETMAPQYRLQLSVEAADGVRLMADAHPDGMTRGLATFPDGKPVVHFGPEAKLKASRIMHGGRLHQSVVAASDVDGIGGALMRYAQTSAQVTATIGVACTDDSSGIRRCGGFVVQLLPDPPQAALMVMTERLAHDFSDLGRMLERVDEDARALADELLFGMEYSILSEQEAAIRCNCSSPRVVGALASLGRAEIARIVEEAELLSIDCDYCRTTYQVGPEQLRSLLVDS